MRIVVVKDDRTFIGHGIMVSRYPPSAHRQQSAISNGQRSKPATRRSTATSESWKVVPSGYCRSSAGAANVEGGPITTTRTIPTPAAARPRPASRRPGSPSRNQDRPYSPSRGLSSGRARSSRSSVTVMAKIGSASAGTSAMASTKADRVSGSS